MAAAAEDAPAGSAEGLAEDADGGSVKMKRMNPRKAFQKGDVEASRGVHEQRRDEGRVGKSKEPHQGKAGEYIQAVVFGGLDGIITTFAVVAASSAASLRYGLILIIGFANLLGDAVGMAVGDYLSSRAEDEHQVAEQKRERWEMDNLPEVEKKEMVDIYVRKGVSEADAREIVDLLFSNREGFLSVMMVEELGMLPAGQGVVAWKSAIVTFTSFLICGGLPMLPYLFSIDYNKSGGFDYIFGIAVSVFSLTLFALGAARGIITGKPWWLHGGIMLGTGVVTTGVAFVSGYFLEKVAKNL